MLFYVVFGKEGEQNVERQSVGICVSVAPILQARLGDQGLA